MYWFSRPPYLRYAVAAALIVGGLAVELRPPATTSHPYAVADIVTGTELTSDLFEMREVSVGVLAQVEIGGWARTVIRSGEPLLSSHQDLNPPSVPDGWWALQVPLPEAARTNTEIRLVVRSVDATEPTAVIPGVVVSGPASATDPLGFDALTGLVAIPEQHAARAAAAVADRRITVLLRPDA